MSTHASANIYMLAHRQKRPTFSCGHTRARIRRPPTSRLAHRSRHLHTRPGERGARPCDSPRRSPEHASYIVTEPINEHGQTCQALSLLAGFFISMATSMEDQELIPTGIPKSREDVPVSDE